MRSSTAAAAGIFGMFALSALSLNGCVTEEVSDEPPTAAEMAQADSATGAPGDQQLLFDCKPAPGSPHDVLQVIALVPEGGENEAAGEIPAILDVTHGKEGMRGHCLRESGKYTCASNDGSLKVLFNSPAPKAAETVEVQEKWLFGTKKYEAVCQFKG